MKDTLLKEGYLSIKEVERFISKTIIQKKSGCWEWQANMDKDGYGVFLLRRKNRRAHRVAWYSVNGVVGKDFVIDHICRNHSCVNPTHLRRFTTSENTLQNSNSIGALNRAKKKCKNGHPFDRFYGQRCCSICQAAKTKRLRKKWAEKPLLEEIGRASCRERV